MEKIRPLLAEVPATLLVPLWARAEEQKRSDPLVRDPRSAEILRALDFDFSRFSGGWMSQLGCCIRTVILDREVQRFLDAHPGSTVINLGCGLDTRVSRLLFRYGSSTLALFTADSLDRVGTPQYEQPYRKVAFRMKEWRDRGQSPVSRLFIGGRWPPASRAAGRRCRAARPSPGP